MPPVFYLPGGPGGSYSEGHFTGRYGKTRAAAWMAELKVLNRNRDLIVLNQRGHSFAPGFSIPNFEYSYERGQQDKPLDIGQKALNQQRAFANCIERFQEKGVDVTGYDIINIVDDIEDIRQHFGYGQVALVGTSFGSQWALGYIHRYPQLVDRAMLSGVEPMDHAWDDAEGIWKVLERIEQAAMTDPKISGDLPAVGLLEAVKTIVRRLEESPAKVHLQIPEKDIDEWILLGADDFRFETMCPYAEDRKESLELWPKYITELYQEDYSLLAHRAQSGRAGTSWSLMINHLIDNSIGISKEREAVLSARPEIQWIGDPSVNYKATRQVSPMAPITAAFRKPVTQDIPILMIHGNMDWNTPIENAQYVQKHYKNTHLITVERGTHSAKREWILADKQAALQVFEFMNIDFKKRSFEEYKKTLPVSYSLPKINFDPLIGRTIMGEVLGH